MEHKCNALINKILNYDRQDETNVRVYKDIRGWVLELDSTEGTNDTKINNCPYCGEKL